MSSLALGIWAVTLAVIAVVIVPLAISLLRRALAASQAIEAYTADMLTAGVGIAGHTAAVPALDATLATAASMIPVAEAIADKTAAAAEFVGGVKAAPT